MPTLEQLKESEWFKERPQIIQDLILEFPYAASVRIKATNQKAYVFSWSEDGTIRVIIDPEENVTGVFDEPYSVFGYKPEDLEFMHENPTLILEED